jgi:ATP/maltotriose-dependent transcriptional regulator MalT
MAGLLPPRRPRTVTTYAVHLLDGSREDYALNREQRHREAAPDDPWLSPEKSEAIRALLVLIEFAQAHTYSTAHIPDNDYDLKGFCEDAKLTERQTEVICMIGEGWGIMAISRQLGLSHPTVIQHLRTGRGKLLRLVLPMDTYDMLEWPHVELAHLQVS